MLISGLNKTTLLDYPGRVAATVFTGGCNFRCPFCHNGGLVLSPLTQEHYTEEDILGFLKKRKHILSGVCITVENRPFNRIFRTSFGKLRNWGWQ